MTWVTSRFSRSNGVRTPRRLAGDGWIVRLCAAIMLCLVWTVPAHAARRAALIIGNSHYVNAAALANTAGDARRVAEAAQQAGFSVTLATDLTKDAFNQALREFRDQADGADVAMVYYAGHGIEGGGKNWILPVDVKLTDPRDLSLEALELNTILSTLEGARLRIVALDACRENPFGNSWRSGTRAVSQGLAEMEIDGALVIYAAAGGQLALDTAGNGTGSPFAEALAKRLPEPGLSIHRLGPSIRDDVKESTGGKQVPWMSVSIGSEDLSLVPKPEPVVAIAPAPAPAPVPAAPPPSLMMNESMLWAGVDLAGTVESYQGYLEAFPQGQFANLARIKLDRLRAAAAVPTAAPSPAAAPVAPPAPALVTAPAPPPAPAPAPAPALVTPAPQPVAPAAAPALVQASAPAPSPAPALAQPPAAAPAGPEPKRGGLAGALQGIAQFASRKLGGATTAGAAPAAVPAAAPAPAPAPAAPAAYTAPQPQPVQPAPAPAPVTQAPAPQIVSFAPAAQTAPGSDGYDVNLHNPRDTRGLPLIPPAPRLSTADYPNCRESYQSIVGPLDKIAAINSCIVALGRFSEGTLNGFAKAMILHQEEISRLYSDRVGGKPEYTPESQNWFYSTVMREHAASNPGGANYSDHAAAKARFDADIAYLRDRYCFWSGTCGGYSPPPGVGTAPPAAVPGQR